MPFLIKHWKISLIVLALMSLYTYTRYEIHMAVNKVKLEQQIESQKEYIDTRKEIDNAVKGVSSISSDDATEWLRERSARHKSE